MKNNYPIKYAIMEIKEPTILENGRKAYKTTAYIVSRCFQIEKIKKYEQNGDTKEKYRVVFAYEKEENSWYRKEPLFDIENECLNYETVEKVFDTYKEALKEAKKKNQDLFYQNVDIENELKEEEKKQADKMEYYKRLEKEMEEKTQDLVVSSPIKPQNIIIEKGNVRVVNHASLYEFIRFWSNKAFIVYTLKEEEFKKLEEEIRRGNFKYAEEKIEKTLLLENDPETKITKIITPKGEQSEYYLKDKYMLYDPQKSFTKTKKQREDVIVYTREDYEDIIKSHIPNFVSMEKEVQIGNKIYAKRLKI